MQNKRHRPQAIDNFVPQGRTLGPSPIRKTQAFPDVGMTMSSYRGTLPPVTTAGPELGFGNLTTRPKRRKHRFGFRGIHWTKKKIIFVILLPFILIGMWLGIKFILNASHIFKGNLFQIFSTTQLRGETEGRVNLLLAGNSTDDPGHNGAALTDSIMIMSIDTRNHKAFLLSVPRDLYVDIAGYQHAKINEAFVAGEQQKFRASGFPSGGMGLLEQTLGENLGIKIHYYALINYGALRDAVNAVGGVDVTIKSDSSCGLYDPSTDWTTGGPLVRLSNGKHHLDGREALNLARARGDAPGSCGYANSDFTRTANQRMLLLQLKNKVTSTGVLANPVKLSSLFDSLGRNVKTDMQLNEVRRLYDITKQTPDSQLKSYGLNDLHGKDYLASYRTPSGQSALVPAAGVDDFSDIRRALNRLMSTNPVAQEGAQVAILNGTETFGLAGKNQDLLTARNIDVTTIADAASPATATFIINASGTTKPATLKALKTVYPDSKVTTSNPYATKYPDADFIIVLGDDSVASSTPR